jgi:menaquinone-dependent protoporphyrinogen oxidase
MTRILIAFGSKRGGTAGLATMIAEAFTEAGYEATIRPADAVRSLAGVDAVIVAGALYANRWHRDARLFIRRHNDELRRLPVWLVSSGSLDDSATQHEIPPAAQLSKLAERVNARGHITFGGRLAPDAKGFPASAMAKKMAGDWRDPEQIRRWVQTLVTQLQSERDAPGNGRGGTAV